MVGKLATRKRARSATEQKSQGPSAKRKQPEKDEEILSDEVDSDPEVDKSSVESSSESEHENETVEEKRLRLARAYLRHVGVSEDAAASDGDDSNGEELGASNQMLREHALRDQAKSFAHIADRFSASISSIKINKCKGHVLSPTCVALCSLDDATAVSGGKDARLIVWDVETGKRRHVFKPTIDEAKKKNPVAAKGHVGNILAVAITDDGNTAVSGGRDGLIRVWDVRAGNLIQTLRGHRDAVTGLTFRSGSRQLFSASADRTVKIWDINEMAYVETLFGHGGDVNAISSMSMERALSCGRDGTLRLYKVVEGSQLVFRNANTISLDTVAMISEHRFVSGGDDGTVCLWQMNKKKPLSIIEHAHGSGLGCENWISAVSAFRNADLAVSGAGDGFLRFWKCEDVPKLQPVGSLEVGPGFVNGIAIGHQNRILATAVGTEHRLGRWASIKKSKNMVQFLSLPNYD
ncbi:WD40/YVTN repeat-like containing protein [Gracilaria domingensis]|nr:WD40/YVTN repeat-like containing protein [Gracilaria domingensis]